MVSPHRSAYIYFSASWGKTSEDRIMKVESFTCTWGSVSYFRSFGIINFADCLQAATQPPHLQTREEAPQIGVGSGKFEHLDLEGKWETTQPPHLQTTAPHQVESEAENEAERIRMSFAGARCSSTTRPGSPWAAPLARPWPPSWRPVSSARVARVDHMTRSPWIR